MVALYGEAKVRAYRAASAFVLPTHSENFGMTVAEALAAGTPAIVTTGAPWEGLEQQGAGWWIQIGVDPLVACLTEVMALPPPRLSAMGQAGRAWMARDFHGSRSPNSYPRLSLAARRRRHACLCHIELTTSPLSI